MYNSSRVWSVMSNQQLKANKNTRHQFKECQHTCHLKAGSQQQQSERQTEAMHLIQWPPPLFGHGYSHYSFLPPGNSLKGSYSNSFSTSATAFGSWVCTKQRCLFSALGMPVLLWVRLKAWCYWLILSVAACTSCLKLTLSCTKSKATCSGSDEVRKQTSKCSISRMQ